MRRFLGSVGGKFNNIIADTSISDPIVTNLLMVRFQNLILCHSKNMLAASTKSASKPPLAPAAASKMPHTKILSSQTTPLTALSVSMTMGTGIRLRKRGVG